MPNWLLKTAAHRAISWLPNRHLWNGLFQRFITKSTRLSPAGFEIKLGECKKHLDSFFSVSGGTPDFRALELGTGWYPIMPIALYLCGARKVWTIDIDPWLSSGRLALLFKYFNDSDASGDLKKFFPAMRSERIVLLRELMNTAKWRRPEVTLAELGIQVIVGDARMLRLPGDSVDFFVSNGVLEYIPKGVLADMLREFRRMAASKAFMSHRLNLGDVFSYFDKSITPFNYLQYTEKQWHWRNSPLVWQNRLRISDYRELIASAGFKLLKEESVSGLAEELATVPLAPEFRHYKNADLLVLHSYLQATAC